METHVRINAQKEQRNKHNTDGKEPWDHCTVAIKFFVKVDKRSELGACDRRLTMQQQWG